MNIMASLVDLNQRKCGGEDNNKTKQKMRRNNNKKQNKTEEKKSLLFFYETPIGCISPFGNQIRCL